MHELINKYRQKPKQAMGKNSISNMIVPDRQVMEMYAELVDKKYEIMYEIGMESSNLLKKIRTFFDIKVKRKYDIMRGREGSYYPGIDHLLMAEDKVLHKGIGVLTACVEQNNQNYQQIRKLRGDFIETLKQAYETTEEYGPVYEELRRDVIQLSRLANSNNTSVDNKIAAVEAEFRAAGKFYSVASDFLVAKGNMRSILHTNNILKNFEALVAMIGISSNIKLNTYKNIEKTVNTFATVIRSIDKTVRVSTGMEQSFSKIQGYLQKYKGIFEQLGAIEYRQLENVVGSEEAAKTRSFARYNE